MTSIKNVQNAHVSEQFRKLHGSVLDIVAVMNRPQRDEIMVRAAGITLDRALFPLLVLVGKYGPIGVVELADRNGRDHTTVSRQVARLEELGLVTRQANARDRRIREAVITPKGKEMTDRIDVARERLTRQVFADWDEAELDTLVAVLRRYADAILKVPEV